MRLARLIIDTRGLGLKPILRGCLSTPYGAKAVCYVIRDEGHHIFDTIKLIRVAISGPVLLQLGALAARLVTQEKS